MEVTLVGVVVMAKPLVVGHVKTRLARHQGEERAVAYARAFLQDTWSMIREVPSCSPVLASCDAGLASCLPSPIETIDQGTGELGVRLERVAHVGLQRYPRVVLLGADTPHLPVSHLRALIAQLEEEDAALGPAEDGGFWGLALTRCPPAGLANVRWSTRHTERDTRCALQRAGLSVGVGKVWYDVDEEASLRRMLSETPDASLCETRRVAQQSREVT